MGPRSSYGQVPNCFPTVLSLLIRLLVALGRIDVYSHRRIVAVAIHILIATNGLQIANILLVLIINVFAAPSISSSMSSEKRYTHVWPGGMVVCEIQLPAGCRTEERVGRRAFTSERAGVSDLSIHSPTTLSSVADDATAYVLVSSFHATLPLTISKLAEVLIIGDDSVQYTLPLFPIELYKDGVVDAPNSQRLSCS